MSSLTFLYTFYFISIGICVLGLINTLAYVFPLQIREAKVVDGLEKLRILMLIYGTINIIINTTIILSLSLRFFITGDFARYSIVLLIFIISLGILFSSLIMRKIYTQNFVEKDEHTL